METGKINTTQIATISIALMIVAAGSFYISYSTIHEQSTDIDLVSFSTTSWVPILVLRDPPGSGSYSKFFLRNADGIALRFENTTMGVNVTGTFSADLIHGSHSTSDTNNSDFVLVAKLNQTWIVLNDTNSGFLLELDSCRIVSEPEMISVECAMNRGIWIAGPPSHAIYVSNRHISGSSGYEINEYRFSRNPFTWKQFIGIRAGYYVDVYGFRTSITVSIDLRGATLCTKTYMYVDQEISYTILSDAYVEYHYPDLYICSGMFLWFENS